MKEKKWVRMCPECMVEHLTEILHGIYLKKACAGMKKCKSCDNITRMEVEL